MRLILLKSIISGIIIVLILNAGFFILTTHYYYKRSLKLEYCLDSVDVYKQNYNWLLISLDNALNDFNGSIKYFREIYEFELVKWHFINTLKQGK
jgi:hypothetical protein